MTPLPWYTNRMTSGNGLRTTDYGLRTKEPVWLWPRASYIHVPFCAHHCGYCDFAVATGQDHQIDLYIEALTAELASLGKPQDMETLFLGGGTPTYLDVRRLARLLEVV